MLPNEAPTKLAQLLIPLQAAEVLAISPRTLWAQTSPRGPIPSVRIGRTVRYDVADIQAFIESHKQKGL